MWLLFGKDVPVSFIASIPIHDFATLFSNSIFAWSMAIGKALQHKVIKIKILTNTRAWPIIIYIIDRR